MTKSVKEIEDEELLADIEASNSAMLTEIEVRPIKYHWRDDYGDEYIFELRINHLNKTIAFYNIVEGRFENQIFRFTTKVKDTYDITVEEYNKAGMNRMIEIIQTI
jgi:hypothetical protein